MTQVSIDLPILPKQILLEQELLNNAYMYGIFIIIRTSVIGTKLQDNT